MKNLTRRQFLGLCAGAALLGGGGWAFARGLLLPEVKEKAAVLLGGEKIRALRQIVAGDNKTSRTVMWQSPVQLTSPAVELAGGEGGGAVFPAQEEVFTDDGVTAYLYTAALTGLSSGTPYGYRVTAGGEAGAWNSLTTDDGGAFTALIFPDSQSNDYSGWKQLAQDAAARTPEASFFVSMGDLVDNGEDHTQWAAWFDAVEGIIDRIPAAPLMGNHETYNQQWKVRESLLRISVRLLCSGMETLRTTGAIIPLTMGRCILRYSTRSRRRNRSGIRRFSSVSRNGSARICGARIRNGRLCSCTRIRFSTVSITARSAPKVFLMKAGHGCRFLTRPALILFCPRIFIPTATAGISRIFGAMRPVRSIFLPA